MKSHYYRLWFDYMLALGNQKLLGWLITVWFYGLFFLITISASKQGIDHWSFGIDIRPLSTLQLCPQNKYVTNNNY